jgi:hypothetical protein
MRLEGEKQAKKQEVLADLELRAEEWKDVQRYHENQRQKERESIAWRIANATRKHEIELSNHQENLAKLHLDLGCRREDWISLQEYKKDEQEKRRKSIAMRLESWKKQKMIEEQTKLKELMIEEEDAILREMDREELLAVKLTQQMMEKHNMISSNSSMIH